MQDVVWQRWLEIWRRVGAELEQAPARLSVRRAELGIALALTFFYLLAGGLAGRWFCFRAGSPGACTRLARRRRVWRRINSLR
jgi:hypothetical protein